MTLSVQRIGFEGFDHLQYATGLKASRHMRNFCLDQFSLSRNDIQAAYIAEQNAIIAIWLYCPVFNRSFVTYVENKYRRRGLASLLWLSEPKPIKGASCTNAGFGFLSAISKKKRHVGFLDVR